MSFAGDNLYREMPAQRLVAFLENHRVFFVWDNQVTIPMDREKRNLGGN